jgi:hypothetical protein
MKNSSINISKDRVMEIALKAIGNIAKYRAEEKDKALSSYLKALDIYNNKPFFKKMFSFKPKDPRSYDEWNHSDFYYIDKSRAADYRRAKDLISLKNEKFNSIDLDPEVYSDLLYISNWYEDN